MWSKLAVILLFTLVSVGPIIYGLSVYDWDIKSAMTPVYQPPKIDFRTNIKDYKFEGSRLYIILNLKNLGEINISIEGLDSSLYGFNGRNISKIILVKPILVKAGGDAEMSLYLTLDNATILKILTYVLETRKTSFILKGNVKIKVYASQVIFPLNMSVNLPQEMINHYISGFSIKPVSANLVKNILKLDIMICNPTPLTWRIDGSALKLYTENGDEIGDLLLNRGINITGGEKKIIALELPLTHERIMKIISYFGSAQEKTFKILGSITISSLGYQQTLNINLTIQLNKDVFTGK